MPNLESLSAPHNATSVIGDPAEQDRWGKEAYPQVPYLGYRCVTIEKVDT
jgi:hypothetical protein